jgi:predicted lysophospholipase L1 biosynthesis ABC-type transport system permease subunit
LFPSGGGVGATVALAYPKGKRARIVGIAGDVRGRRMTIAPDPYAYFPDPAPNWGTVQVRSQMPAPATIAAIRDVARAVDPVVLPGDLERFDAAIDRALAEQRLFARLSALFAVIAAVLAGIGIYGMMSGAVAERRREFGIRLALGASARSVMSLVLRHALLLAGIGMIVGIAGAAALRQLIEARLYGVRPLEPAIVVLAVGALLIVSLLACLVPGLRATRVDPVRSLRVD